MLVNSKDYVIRKKYTWQKDKTIFIINQQCQTGIGQIQFKNKNMGRRFRLKIEYVKLGDKTLKSLRSET